MSSHFEDLASFKDSVEKATRFTIKVELVNGTFVMSSGLPIEHLGPTIVDIEASDAARTALAIWDRESGKLVMIPHHQILFTSLVFA